MSLLNIACRITLLRIALVPGALALVFLGQPWAYVTAALVCAVAGATDALDGYLARHFCGETRLGAVLDLTADKFLVLGTTSAMAFQGLLPLWVPGLLCLREAAVGGLRLETAQHGGRLCSDAWGKAKTAVSVVAVVGLLLQAGLTPEANDSIPAVLGLVKPLLSLSWWAVMLAVGLSLFSGLRYFAMSRPALPGMHGITPDCSLKEPSKSLAGDP